MDPQDQVLTKPNVTLSVAESIARDHFSLTGEAQELPSERDQNFRIDSEQGIHVLKIANPQTAIDLVELENSAIGVVEALDCIESPSLVRSTSGSAIASIKLATGESCLVRCLEYVPGKPLAKFLPHSLALLTDIGRLIGEVDMALQCLNSNSAAKRNLKWDLANSRDIVSSARPLSTDTHWKAEILEQSLKRYERIADRIEDLPESVIHNDANDYNILIQHDPKNGMAMVGLIDFGDIVYSKTVYELAICIAYSILNKSNPIESAIAIASGYHLSRRLTESEMSVLFPLVCMRLTQSVCISAEQKKLCPDNEYLSITEKPAWETLKQLAALDATAIHLNLSDACDSIAMNKRISLSKQTTRLEPSQILEQRNRYVAPSLSLSSRPCRAGCHRKRRLAGACLATGRYLLEGLKELQTSFCEIGDVRGSGLFLGIELVEPDAQSGEDGGNSEGKKPASQLAHRLVQKMKHRRILLSTDGPLNNVIKIKPPLAFSRADAERLVETMGRELRELVKN